MNKIIYQKIRDFVQVNLILLIWIIIFLIIGGCSIPFQQLIDPPSLTYEGIYLKNTSLFEVTHVFKFRISNTNPMGLSIRNITYNLKMNNEKFIKGMLDRDINLKAIGASNVELPITFSYLDVFGYSSEFIASDNIRYDLSGTIGAGPFAVPYHLKGIFDVPKFPEISLEHIEVSDFNFTKASATFVLGIKNANPFEVAFSALNYNIKLGGTEFAAGMIRSFSLIDQNGLSTIKIPIKINFFEIGHSAYDILSESSPVYELSGKIYFNIQGTGIRSFPFRNFGNTKVIRESTEREAREQE